MAEAPPNAGSSPRLDKWLWAARFFKTRSLAAQAIAAGHIRLGGQRAKGARPVRVGDRISVVLGPFTYEIVVSALSAVRRGATEARTLYEETPDSRARREATAALLRAGREGYKAAPERPSKRDRRALERLRGR